MPVSCCWLLIAYNLMHVLEASIAAGSGASESSATFDFFFLCFFVLPSSIFDERMFFLIKREAYL